MTLSRLCLRVASVAAALIVSGSAIAASSQMIVKSKNYEFRFPKAWVQLEPGPHEPGVGTKIGVEGAGGVAAYWCSTSHTPFPQNVRVPYRNEVANAEVVPVFKQRFDQNMTEAGGKDLVTDIKLVDRDGYPLHLGIATGTFPFGDGGERLATEMRGLSLVATDGVHALRCAFHEALLDRPADEVRAEIEQVLDSLVLQEDGLLPMSPLGRTLLNSD